MKPTFAQRPVGKVGFACIDAVSNRPFNSLEPLNLNVEPLNLNVEPLNLNVEPLNLNVDPLNL
ncbi:MAG: hypothetical protein V7K17_09445, partial [Nostoc sp.]